MRTLIRPTCSTWRQTAAVVNGVRLSEHVVNDCHLCCDAKGKQEADQLLLAVAIFLLHLSY